MKIKNNTFFKLFKAYFIRFKLHKIFGVFSEYFIYLGYLSRLSKYVSVNKSKFTYNDFFNRKPDFDSRTELYEYLKKEVVDDIPMNYLEFGVYKGKSFKWWLENFKNSESRFWGYDTFTGLPEKYGNYKPGTFSLDGQLPDIDDERSVLVKGLFQDTVLESFKDIDFSRFSIFHIDVDLYSASLFCLVAIFPHLKKGDIIMFDEFGVPLHEFRAFQDFQQSFYVKLEPIGAKNNYLAAAFRVV
jgi:O-methyltransferase